MSPPAKAGVYALILAGSLVMLVPLAWMVLTSLKSYQDLFAVPPLWFPGKGAVGQLSRSFDHL